jgi:hypothetical protein
MLEREGARGIGRRLPTARRLMWYGGGSVLVVGLVGLLVWLARGSTEQQQVDAIALATPVETSAPHGDARKPEQASASVHPAAAIVEEPQPAAQSQPPASVSPPSEVRTADASDMHGAAVVQDYAVAAGGAAVIENDPLAAPSEQPAPQEVRPSAHMGTAHETMEPASTHLAAAHDKAQTAAAAYDTAQTAAPAHDKAQTAAAAPKPVPAPPVVAVAQPKHTTKAARRERAHSHAAKKATAAHAGRHSAAHAAKGRKPQAIQKAVAVDSDVALISAVIRHANTGDPAAPSCDCAEKATPQP